MTLTHCSTCPRIRDIVPPTGPTPCRVMLLGEGPHRDEDKWGRVFAGKTGKELDGTYLPIANLPRSEVYVCNARWCSNKDYSNPTPEQAFSCSSVHLGEVLSVVRPQVVVPMGAVACSLWPEIHLPLDHGLPQVGKWGPWEGVLFPVYHPSAGIHATSMMIPMMNDFHALGKLLLELPAE